MCVCMQPSVRSSRRSQVTSESWPFEEAQNAQKGEFRQGEPTLFVSKAPGSLQRAPLPARTAQAS